MATSAGHARAGERQTRSSRILVFVLLLLLGGQPGCATALRKALGIPTTGAVEGYVMLPSAGSEAADPLQVVVYLDRLEGKSRSRTALPLQTVRQADGSFSPDLLAVAAGQTVRFSNEDGVYHRIFSSSDPNAFDLGMIETGESREVVLRHEGVVRIYCSLHPWESGMIFVAPTPHFYKVQPPGRYEIVDVPPGRYRLATWGDALPSAAAVVTVQPGRSASIELAIERGGAPR
jgi:plastocyanin